MVLARVATWRFKPNQRKTGFDALEKSVTQLFHNSEGFRGSLVLLSREDPDLGIIVTLWNSEELERAFSEGVFQLAIKELKPFVTGPPEIALHTVFSAELTHR